MSVPSQPPSSARGRHSKLAVAGLLVILLSVYLVLGLGFHRLNEACSESRNRHRRDDVAFDGGAALIIDVVMWPLNLGFSALFGETCTEPSSR